MSHLEPDFPGNLDVKKMGLVISLDQAAHSVDDQMGVGNPFPRLRGGTNRASKTRP
jgi:hypothetical protein